VTGAEYRDLVASYIVHNFAARGLVVYTEVSLGKTIIGKDRKVDVFVVRAADQRALAIECKYQETQGTTDEKIPYALQDLEALWIVGCLAYAGDGWSTGVLHTLQASRLAASCLPDATTLDRSKATEELDHVLAATFGLWELVIPERRRFELPR
jgi:PD-(D/E)XK nuclease superfamily domain